jgi:anthranilate synthase
MPKLDLAVLSPGPGCPSDFGVSQHIQRLLDRKVPIFGVCLGLQSIVEHFGGKLAQLSYPMHGKPSKVQVDAKLGCTGIFEGLPDKFGVARYHSLYGQRPLPDCLQVTAAVAPGELGGPALPGQASNGDDIRHLPIIMGVHHRTLPVAAVQFHPESILTSPEFGVQMLQNALKMKPAKA